MPKDRRQDRHANKSAHVVRFDPPDLWERLGDAVGERHRTATINDLVRRFLEGKPMPKRTKSGSE